MTTKIARQNAEYVESQLRELALLSRKSGLNILANLIEMAELEAENQRYALTSQLNKRGKR